MGQVQREEATHEACLRQSLPGGDLPDYLLIVVDLGPAFGSPTGGLILSMERKEMMSVGNKS